jgi:hypothetical protein
MLGERKIVEPPRRSNRHLMGTDSSWVGGNFARLACWPRRSGRRRPPRARRQLSLHHRGFSDPKRSRRRSRQRPLLQLNRSRRPLSRRCDPSPKPSRRLKPRQNLRLSSPRWIRPPLSRCRLPRAVPRRRHVGERGNETALTRRPSSVTASFSELGSERWGARAMSARAQVTGRRRGSASPGLLVSISRGGSSWAFSVDGAVWELA